jgi:hypothetical protein
MSVAHPLIGDRGSSVSTGAGWSGTGGGLILSIGSLEISPSSSSHA